MLLACFLNEMPSFFPYKYNFNVENNKQTNT